MTTMTFAGFLCWSAGYFGTNFHEGDFRSLLHPTVIKGHLEIGMLIMGHSLIRSLVRSLIHSLLSSWDGGIFLSNFPETRCTSFKCPATETLNSLSKRLVCKSKRSGASKRTEQGKRGEQISVGCEWTSERTSAWPITYDSILVLFRTTVY